MSFDFNRGWVARRKLRKDSAGSAAEFMFRSISGRRHALTLFFCCLAAAPRAAQSASIRLAHSQNCNRTVRFHRTNADAAFPDFAMP
jgi:hypothetical protein